MAIPRRSGRGPTNQAQGEPDSLTIGGLEADGIIIKAYEFVALEFVQAVRTRYFSGPNGHSADNRGEEHSPSVKHLRVPVNS
jgi:hypothetical protein